MISPGDDVGFPYDGPCGGAAIVRIDDASFRLVEPGTYQVQFVVCVNESAQLTLALNGDELPYTLSGRSEGYTQIVSTTLIQTDTPNAVLTVRNPAANPNTLRLTPNAGGTQPVSAHLVIVKLA